MRVLVTGGTGFVGSAVITELIRSGHQVLGLVRSETSARALVAAGAQAHPGDVTDTDALREATRGVDGVVHLAMPRTAGGLGEAMAVERSAIAAFGDALEGTGAPLVFASATSLIAPGRRITENDVGDTGGPIPRVESEREALSRTDRGVRVIAVRLPTLVHGTGDAAGFLPMLVAAARARGVSAYVGDGDNRWPAVHRADAAVLFRQALESGRAGARLHAVAEEGVAFRDIARAIGDGLGLPTLGLTPERAAEHFPLPAGPLSALPGTDIAASAQLTREAMGWRPEHPDLLTDLAEGHYLTLGDAA